MKIMVLGAGLMGPAAAFNAMTDPAVTKVTVCDLDEDQLAQCRARLEDKPGAHKVVYQPLDLSDQDATMAAMKDHQAGIAALPRAASLLAIPSVLKTGMALMDLTRIPDEVIAGLKAEYTDAAGVIVLGCGLEPGLTEIMARHLAERLDRTDELHIQCGGIPANPQPPLSYKIVFGGTHLPFHETDARVVENGILKPVPRYSDAEPTTFEGVGACEAWHEGFMPWLLDLNALKDLRTGTQKTVRWPGYAAKVTALKELGLLSEEPIEVNGVSVIPKHVVDAVLYPHVKMQPEDRDITTFRVTVIGEKDGQPTRLTADMVDHYDEQEGFSSMARTTAFTAAIVARMIARGEWSHPGVPFTTPEQVIAGPLFDTLVKELAAMNINFEIKQS
jgi:saccharopine dehydrogenase-like NADP-dependent oxidoreductase